MTHTAAPTLIQTTIQHAQALAALENLAPSPTVDRLFSGLVGNAAVAANSRVAEKILGEIGETVPLGDIHQLCSRGEIEMERHWALKIRDAADPVATLRSFPYYNNYRKLAKLEADAILSAQPTAKRLLFIGCGSLPLSSYMLARHHGMDVLNIDIEEEATDCACEWMEKVLGTVKGKLDCLHSDVMDFTDFDNFDVVVLAALVGLDQATKRKVMAHLAAHMRPEQLLLVRSVRGLRKILYPVVAREDVAPFNVERVIHPRGEVINSVILGRLPA